MKWEQATYLICSYLAGHLRAGLVTGIFIIIGDLLDALYFSKNEENFQYIFLEYVKERLRATIFYLADIVFPI